MRKSRLSRVSYAVVLLIVARAVRVDGAKSHVRGGCRYHKRTCWAVKSGRRWAGAWRESHDARGSQSAGWVRSMEAITAEILNPKTVDRVAQDPVHWVPSCMTRGTAELHRLVLRLVESCHETSRRTSSSSCGGSGSGSGSLQPCHGDDEARSAFIEPELAPVERSVLASFCTRGFPTVTERHEGRKADRWGSR